MNNITACRVAICLAALLAGPTLSPLRAQPGASPAKWELYEETQLEGSISGTVTRGSIFKTTSGNVYEVTGLTLQLVLELQPDVIVLRSGVLSLLLKASMSLCSAES